MYDNFDCIYYIVNTMFRVCRNVYNYVFGINQAPDNATWMSISTITKLPILTVEINKNSDNRFIYYITVIVSHIVQKINDKFAQLNIRYSDNYAYEHSENFFGIDQEWDEIVYKIISIHEIIECDNSSQLSSINVSEENDCHILTIARNIDHYNVRVSTDILLISNIGSFIKKTVSSVRFIAIEYCHPKMNYQVSICLPKGMYLAGNEILSSVFVMRWLANNMAKNSYIFDMDYVLHIMDNNIKYAEITSREYCIITDDGWLIEEFA